MVEPGGLYIHIPFCQRKCTYCNFNTTDFDRDLATPYARALVKEAGYWGDLLASPDAASPIQFDTIYFGGGTPSIIEPELIGDVTGQCHCAFDISAHPEVTIEINPGSLERQRIERWLEAGVNRASVGIQSFVDDELTGLSRTHTAAEARDTVRALREAGFVNISLDLIAGLPDQSVANWTFNLTEALALEPEHMSLYLLEVKEGTQLFGQIKHGLRPSPDDDLAAEMYQMIVDRTAGAGYEQYEISNFARRADPDRQEASPFRSRHNMKYWTGAQYYGLGCGAHSYDGQRRWVNIARTQDYMAAVETTGRAVEHTDELAHRDRAIEALFMGLRLIEGIDLTNFRNRYDFDVRNEFSEAIDRMIENGLVQLDEDRMRLTARGLLLSNEVFVEFV